jgi:hypothetical protein
LVASSQRERALLDAVLFREKMSIGLAAVHVEVETSSLYAATGEEAGFAQVFEAPGEISRYGTGLLEALDHYRPPTWSWATVALRPRVR